MVAIVALLAAFGHTAYQRFLIRARIVEAINVLDEYQSSAIRELSRTGTISAYYTLFSNSDNTGLLSGAPGDPSASKQVDLKYVDMVTVDVTDNINPITVLIGARLRDSGDIITGANFVYVEGHYENGVFNWRCGSSTSKANNVSSVYLPATCQAQLD